MKFGFLVFLSLALLVRAGSEEYFTPAHRISGIGVERADLSDELLALRTSLMIQSQTFAILRDPESVPGAKRITQDRMLQAQFESAAKQSGLPATLLEAIAYLESWGDAKAASHTGPRGVMQISAATAHDMGLKVIIATRYKTTREKVQVKGKNGKPKYKTVRHRVPYTVAGRDDRLVPNRAIPAAARYLAAMEQKYGGRDWAIFAYHCGQGCVNEMMDLTRRARGIPKDQITVPRMFFSCTPSWNRELYQAIEQQMQRDYSPTYYFRVLRAEQLLALYREDPATFTEMAQQYKSEFSTAYRAPHRLSVWLKRDDVIFRTCDDIRSDAGKRLVKALQNPDYLGYSLRISPDSAANLEYFSEASPAAVGTLTYIAFETRRLFEALSPGEKFQPLLVTALVEPQDFAQQSGHSEALSHCTGQVFDIDYAGMPPRELECLRFMLDDLGWDGYLGFIEEGRDNLHIGCSPSSRDFFSTVFQEASGTKTADSGAPQAK